MTIDKQGTMFFTDDYGKFLHAKNVVAKANGVIP